MTTSRFRTNPGYRTLEVAAPKPEKSDLARLLLVMGLILGAALSFVWCKGEMQRLHKELTSLEGKHEEMKSRVRNLKLRRSTLTTRQHLSKAVAEYDLNLRPPAPGQVRQIPFDEVSDVEQGVSEQRVFASVDELSEENNKL